MHVHWIFTTSADYNQLRYICSDPCAHFCLLQQMMTNIIFFKTSALMTITKSTFISANDDDPHST